MSETDEGADTPEEIDIPYEVEPTYGDVPGYLAFADEALRDEGRNAYALSLLNLAEGDFLDGWEAKFVKLVRCLKLGEAAIEQRPNLRSAK